MSGPSHPRRSFSCYFDNIRGMRIKVYKGNQDLKEGLVGRIAEKGLFTLKTPVFSKFISIK